MTTTDRADILTILSQHHDLLGVDRKRVKELIDTVGSIYATDPVDRPKAAKAIKAVEQVTNYTLLSLQTKAAQRHISEARQIMAYTLYDICGQTFEDVGRMINRNHATVMYCVRQVENNPRIFNARIKEIQTRLTPFGKG
jgi:chromosomal replication initiation ATPase DnaA